MDDDRSIVVSLQLMIGRAPAQVACIAAAVRGRAAGGRGGMCRFAESSIPYSVACQNRRGENRGLDAGDGPGCWLGCRSRVLVAGVSSTSRCRLYLMRRCGLLGW